MMMAHTYIHAAALCGCRELSFLIFDFSPTRLIMVRSCRHTIIMYTYFSHKCTYLNMIMSSMHVHIHRNTLTETFNATDMEKVNIRSTRMNWC